MSNADHSAYYSGFMPCSCIHPNQHTSTNPSPTERVSLDFAPVSLCCCFSCSTVPFRPDLPAELLAAGVTESAWAGWMDSYEDNVAPHTALPLGSMSCAILSALLVLPIFLIVAFDCFSFAKNDPFQNAMKKWLEEVNTSLAPLGMLAKAQTVANDTSFTWSRDRTKARSCLSFATTVKESEQLRSEPVIMKGSLSICGLGWWSRDRVV